MQEILSCQKDCLMAFDNCPKFNNETYKCQSMELASKVSGAVSLVVSILVLILLLLYKYYREFEERIILGMQITVLVTSITYVSNGGYKNKALCSFMGVLISYVGWSLSLWAIIMTSNFVMKISQSNSYEELRERQWLVYCIAYVFPLIPSLLPLSTGDYGISGFKCWLTSVVWQWATYHVWLMAMILCMLGMYIYIVYKLIKFFYIYEGTGQSDIVAEQRKKIKQRIILIAGYPLAYLSLSIVPFINRLHNILNPPNYGLFMAHAIMSPLRGVIFSVIFTIDLFYSKRLSFAQIKTDLLNVSFSSKQKEEINSKLPDETPTVYID